MTRRGVLVAAVVVPALVLLAGAVLAAGPRTDDDVRGVLLVSGRDDHGLVELSRVPLLDDVDGRATTSVEDGTLVRLLDVDGQWHRVQALEGGAGGWVDDFRLRGVAHLVGSGPSCRPVLGARRVEAGAQVELLEVATGGVLVRLLAEPDEGGVVPVAALRQEPPRTAGGCADVPRYRTDGHAHVH